MSNPITLDAVGTQMWLRDEKFSLTDNIGNARYKTPVCTVQYRDRIKATCICRTNMGLCDGRVLSNDGVVLFEASR